VGQKNNKEMTILMTLVCTLLREIRSSAQSFSSKKNDNSK